MWQSSPWKERHLPPLHRNCIEVRVLQRNAVGWLLYLFSSKWGGGADRAKSSFTCSDETLHDVYGGECHIGTRAVLCFASVTSSGSRPQQYNLHSLNLRQCKRQAFSTTVRDFKIESLWHQRSQFQQHYGVPGRKSSFCYIKWNVIWFGLSLHPYPRKKKNTSVSFSYMDFFKKSVCGGENAMPMLFSAHISEKLILTTVCERPTRIFVNAPQSWVLPAHG